MIEKKLAPEGPANVPDLRSFIERAPVATALFDRDLRYLAASRRWIADFSPRDPDLVGRSHYDVFPRLPDRSREVLKQGLAGETVRLDRDAMRRGDGRTRHINWEVQPWRDDTGEIAGLVIFATDVTAEVEAGRALAESEARYRLLAETSPDIICRSDPDGVIQYVSPACRQLGYAPEEMVGRPVLNFIGIEDARLIRERLDQIAASPPGELFSASLHRVRCKDGRIVWLEGRPGPMRDAEGRFIGVMTVLRDVTERRALERQLKESEERHRLLADSTPDVVVKIGAGDVIEYASPSIAQYGYAPENLVGATAASFLHPEDLPKRTEAIAEFFATGRADLPRDRTYRVRAKDGSYVWVEGKSQVLFDDAGKAIGFVNHLRDLSERRAASQALAESEARFRMLAAQVPDIIVRYDVNGIIEYVSPAVRTLGYEPDEVVGRDIAGFGVEGGTQPVVLSALRRGDALPSGRHNEFQLRRADGTLVWAQGNPAPLFNDAGEPIAIVSVVRDVTRQREMEARLAESEARYRLMAERASDITLQTDAEGVVSYASPACARILGFEPEELVGKSAFEFIHPDQHAWTRQQMARLYAGERQSERERREYRALKKDGGEAWLEGASSVIRDDAGAITGAISHLRDVTDRRAAAEALAQSEMKLRGLFELAPLGIALTDVSGRYVEFNDAFRAICGYPEDELKTLDYWTLTPQEYTADEARQLELLDKTGRYGPYEKEYVRKDGSRIPIRLNGMMIEAADGQPYIWSMVEDITDQLQGEAVLIEARAAAEAAAVAKSEFLANMSHEIRTPLTGVVGFAGLLEQMDALPETARRYARRISTSAETLLAVVNDVLDFSKLEAAQMELDPHAFDPVELAETVTDLVRDRAVRKDIELAARLDGPAPPRLVADSARLRQVLLNFLTNAVKFTESGSITVTTAYDPAAQRLRLSVRDTGLGVPPELADRLFQRFSQVDASSTRRYGGTGLGLAICKSLIDMMEGDIGFERAPGAGSTFWFEITAPAAAEGDEPVAPAAAADVEMGRTTILVVDDVAVNRELVAAMLAPFDVTLVEADSGAAAVKAALAARFDLILMDVQMPGMDGMAATKAIRANSDLNRTTPILAVSANVLPDQVAAAREAGMNDHIAKPLDPAELVGKIAKWAGAGG